MAGLAADQDAAHRPGVADALRRLAAGELGGRRVGQVGAVALAGVDHQDAGGARGVERAGAGADRALEQRDVVAERLAEAAGLEEVALHVDDDERGAAGVEGRSARARRRGGRAHRRAPFGRGALRRERGCYGGTRRGEAGGCGDFDEAAVAAEIRAAFDAYEAALAANDVAALAGFFWEDPRAVRMMTEGGLYGIDGDRRRSAVAATRPTSRAS